MNGQHPVQSLTWKIMLQAYANGVFPMADDAGTDDIFWVDPDARGVIPLDAFHISKSLHKYIRRRPFTATVNHDFAGIVRHCAARDETWINQPLFDLYQQLHHAHHAHSVEIWENGDLAGGVFGITLGGAFFGESMFSTRTNGSKIALAVTVHRLRAHGFTLFDTQFLTDHLASLGACEISRGEYHAQLAAALQAQPTPFHIGPCVDVYGAVQRSTQMS